MSVRMLQGDCRSVLPTLESGSVHCCVTSPPYFGLRDYGTGQWEGGDEGCDHIEGFARHDGDRETPGGRGGSFRTSAMQFRAECAKCGARRIDRQIGLEATPDEYVAELVAVFREVRRVLCDDGTLWLNLGDSYAGGGNYRGVNSMETLTSKQASNRGARGLSQLLGAKDTPGCKPKDLLGIPWRVAFALQADGWWLRQDIIWAKPNPMPESVRDRCTKAHEYVFMLTKSPRYYFDAAAIAEPAIFAGKTVKTNGDDGYESDVLDMRTRDGFRRGVTVGETRNRRSVWTIASQPFAEAHFATMPPALVEPCIKAGCPDGGTVLDPFGGAGTVGLVADRLQRNAVLIDLNGAYADMAQRRIVSDGPLFAEVDVA